jgi:hypothetical protein
MLRSTEISSTLLHALQDQMEDGGTLYSFKEVLRQHLCSAFLSCATLLCPRLPSPALHCCAVLCSTVLCSFLLCSPPLCPVLLSSPLFFSYEVMMKRCNCTSKVVEEGGEVQPFVSFVDHTQVHGHCALFSISITHTVIV